MTVNRCRVLNFLQALGGWAWGWARSVAVRWPTLGWLTLRMTLLDAPVKLLIAGTVSRKVASRGYFEGIVESDWSLESGSQ